MDENSEKGAETGEDTGQGSSSSLSGLIDHLTDTGVHHANADAKVSVEMGAFQKCTKIEDICLNLRKIRDVFQMDDVGEADGDDQMDDQEDNEDVTEDEEEGQTMTGPVQRVSKIRWKLFLLQLCIFFDKKL